MDARQQTQDYVPPDGASILQILNPDKEIEQLMYSFLGLQKMKTKTSSFVERINKPTFTDEYIRDLIKDVRQFVNFTTQVSRYEDKRIKQHVGKYLLSLKSSLATQGDDHFISDETWEKIMEVHNASWEDDNDKDKDGKAKLKSGWAKFGIDWDYNKPVRFEMLKGLKNFEEEVDQTVNFIRLIQALAPFLEGSLNKSFSGSHDAMGMMLSSLGEMRRETQTFTGDKKKRSGSLFKSNDGEEWN